MNKFLLCAALIMTALSSFAQGVKVQAFTTNSGPVVTNIVINLSSNLAPNRLRATNTITGVRVYAATNGLGGFWLDPSTISPGSATNVIDVAAGQNITIVTNGLLRTIIMTNASNGTFNFLQLTNVPQSVSNLVNLTSNYYVGTFTGNGAAVTGVVAAAVSGNLTNTTALASNIVSGITLNVANGENVTNVADMFNLQTRLDLTPSVGFSSWPVFTGQFGNGTTNLNDSPQWQIAWGTNSQRWLTNLINVFRDFPQMVAAGAQTIWMDDGWQNDTRDASGDLGWQTNFFDVGFIEIAQRARNYGVNFHGYTSLRLTTCMNEPGSSTNYIYRDIQRMMDWGWAGTMVDSCDEDLSKDENYYGNFAYLVNRAIREHQAMTLRSNLITRPFAINQVVGFNPVLYTDNQPVSVNGLATFDSIGISGGYTDSNLGPPLAWAAMKTLRRIGPWIGPGRFPWITHLYNSQSSGQGFTNVVNANIITCAVGKLGIGDRTAEWVAGGVDMGGFGPGPNYTDLTNFYVPNLSNPELMGVWKDPAVIPGQLNKARTNELTVVIPRPLGTRLGPTNALYLCNWAATNSTFTISVNDWFGGVSNKAYVLRNPWTRSNMFTFVNAITVNVPSSNSVLFTVYPYGPSPTDIPGLAGWWKYDDLNHLADGALVPEWKDASGNGMTVTNVNIGSQPQRTVDGVAGRPGVYFTLDHLHFPANYTTSNYTTATVFAVVRMTNATLSGYVGIFQTGANDANGTMMLANHNTANKWGVYTTGEQPAFSQLVTNRSYILAMVDNHTGGGKFYLDGQVDGSWTGNSIGSSDAAIGGQSSQIFSGFISEIVFYNRALSDNERADVMDYLTRRYPKW